MEEAIAGFVGFVVAVFGAWAAARKAKKGYVFRPRARARLYLSWRTHEYEGDDDKRTNPRPPPPPPPKDTP